MWVGTGDNCYNGLSQVVDTEEYFAFDDDEWKRMSEEDRMELIREWALDQIDYSYEEVL